MKYNQLGRSSLQVSQIAFGCMSLQSTQAQPVRVVREALDLGINFFDTADLYEQGKNEILLGRALGQKRQEVIIATKVGNQWNAEGTAWNWNPRKDYIITAIENSLKRLSTDYIDLYQLHGGTIDDPIDEVIEAFEQLKTHGKIRAYGISSIRPNVIREYVSRSNIDSVMMQYSLLDRRPEETCLDLLYQRQVSVITRGSLAKGLLAGKSAQSYLDHSTTVIQNVAATIQKIGSKNQITPALTACQYVLQKPVVASAVVGFRTNEQLRDCTNGNQVPALTTDDYAMLQNSVAPSQYTAHR
ncbi:aldo/keto reductase [Microscilla marina]|uniref:Oxidoreductase n=1 Tax=Microscilla marina ATCC 23134 TaxID=313606 RepID=A1ZPI5_MICM2|nr:aldo/keto reductase [Microscilla marina]EAY27724.1 oxidoreductase [Microscilla marina ATCC 23134]